MDKDMLFTLSDVGVLLEKRINNWLIISKELDSVLHLFFRVKVSTEMFLELKFLTITQALETYHRRKRPSVVLPQDEHKNKIKEIIENIPDCHKDWLKQALAYSNEKSLKNRLDELMTESKEIINSLVENSEEFVKTVRNTRNYYTHYDKRMKDKAAKGENLLWLTEKLSILLQSCLLDEIYVNEEDKLKMFERNSYYNFLHSK